MTKHYIFHHDTYWIDEWEFDSYSCITHTLNGDGLDEDDCLLQIVESLDYYHCLKLNDLDEDTRSTNVCKWLADKGITWEFVRIP